MTLSSSFIHPYTGKRIQGIWEERHLPPGERSGTAAPPTPASDSVPWDQAPANDEPSSTANVDEGMAGLAVGGGGAKAKTPPRATPETHANVAKIDLTVPPGSAATDEGRRRAAEQAAGGATTSPHKLTHEDEMNRKLAMVAQANARAAKQVRAC